MTAGEAIAAVDSLRPNQYSTAQKLQWLRRLDDQILAELEMTHRPNNAARSGDIVPPPKPEPASPGFGIAEAEPLPDEYEVETVLGAPFPYDSELYTAYLFCQIDLHNAEIAKYNQSLSLLAAAWRQLADWINRTRRPLGAARWRL